MKLYFSESNLDYCVDIYDRRKFFKSEDFLKNIQEICLDSFNAKEQEEINSRLKDKERIILSYTHDDDSVKFFEVVKQKVKIEVVKQKAKTKETNINKENNHETQSSTGYYWVTGISLAAITLIIMAYNKMLRDWLMAKLSLSFLRT
jgi:hypothetical protein